MSRLGLLDDGQIAVLAKQYTKTLREYLDHYLSDRIQVVQHRHRRQLIGAVPSSVDIARKGGDDALLEKTQVDSGSSIPRFHSALWTAFRKPIDESKRRFMNVPRAATYFAAVKRPLFVAIAVYTGNKNASFDTIGETRDGSPTVQKITISEDLYYTDYYVAGLYAKVARGLQKRQSLNRDKLLQSVNLIIFYVDLNDGSETLLVERFGVEALVISLNVSCILQMPTGTKNQQSTKGDQPSISGNRWRNRFHYDCQLPNRHDRNFPGCHELERIDRGRQHANVAPNDNVR